MYSTDDKHPAFKSLRLFFTQYNPLYVIRRVFVPATNWRKGFILFYLIMPDQQCDCPVRMARRLIFMLCDWAGKEGFLFFKRLKQVQQLVLEHLNESKRVNIFWDQLLIIDWSFIIVDRGIGVGGATLTLVFENNWLHSETQSRFFLG